MRTVTLTTEEFDASWAGLELGRKPYPLDVPFSGRREESTDEHVASLLHVLAHHVTAIDMVADFDGPLRAIAASDGRRGVLAAIRNDSVVLDPIRPTGLAAAVLAVLPQVRAGSGSALSAPIDILQKLSARFADRACDGPTAREAFARAGLSQQDASLMSELATGRTAGGQLGVTHQNERATTVVTWFDTAKGRYLVVSERGWLSVAPADNSRIVSRVESILPAA